MPTITACAADSLKDGEMLAIETADLALAVCRVGGEWFAFENNCTHEDFSLTEGMLDGTEIECALHGARFCLRSGAVRALPASCGIRVFATRVEDNEVRVELPRPTPTRP